ncbi:hypothetical protein VTO73DRAFT_4873 [Trametes versicolor]
MCLTFSARTTEVETNGKTEKVIATGGELGVTRCSRSSTSAGNVNSEPTQGPALARKRCERGRHGVIAAKKRGYSPATPICVGGVPRRSLSNKSVPMPDSSGGWILELRMAHGGVV